MKVLLIQHVPQVAGQDTWALSFSLPYLATAYARAGEGAWYIKTWLTAEQVRRRLAILYSEQDELRILEAGRDFALIYAQKIDWLDGRLEHEDPMELPSMGGPRALWDAFQGLIGSLAQPMSVTLAGSLTGAVTGAGGGPLTGSSARNLRAA